jgi:E3 ubiquitin-protein ligase HUWE1
VKTDLAVAGKSGPDYNADTPEALSVPRLAVLKHLLRSVHRLMHSSGTSEGLRGLIDSSLVHSVKAVIDNRHKFGITVLPLAFNVMATFIHNEPTSLHIIQEIGIAESFYSCIETGLDPSIEIMQSIPTAIGALCLNSAGVNQITARAGVIKKFLGVFISEGHLKVLQEKDYAVVIGSAIDELIRHHPLLGPVIFEALAGLLHDINLIGSKPQTVRQLNHLCLLVDEVSNASGSLGNDVVETGQANRAGSHTESESLEDNVLTMSLDMFCRVSIYLQNRFSLLKFIIC